MDISLFGIWTPISLEHFAQVYRNNNVVIVSQLANIDDLPFSNVLKEMAGMAFVDRQLFTAIEGVTKS